MSSWDVLVFKKGYQFYSPNIKKYYISASVTFFEGNSFFSSSTQDVNFVQQVLPMFLVDPFVYPIPNTIPTSPNNPNSSRYLNSPRRSPQTQKTSPISHDESSLSSPSALLFRTMTLDNEDSSCLIAFRVLHAILILFTNLLNYHCLFPSYCSFIFFVSSITIPKYVKKALDLPGR